MIKRLRAFYEKAITKKHLSERGLNCQYAVRGFIAIEASKIQSQLKDGNH